MKGSVPLSEKGIYGDRLKEEGRGGERAGDTKRKHKIMKWERKEQKKGDHPPPSTSENDIGPPARTHHFPIL